MNKRQVKERWRRYKQADAEENAAITAENIAAEHRKRASAFREMQWNALQAVVEAYGQCVIDGQLYYIDDNGDLQREGVKQL